MAYRMALSFCRECGAAWAEGASVCARCGAARAEATSVPPSGMSTVAGLVSSLALYFVLLATVLALLVLDSVDVFGMLHAILLIDTVAVAAWAVVHRHDLVGPLRTFGERRYWGLVLAAVPVTLALAYANSWFVTDVLGGVEADLVGLYFSAGHSLPLVLLLCAVQPAVIEELAFRGIVFERLSRIFEPKTAVIIAAILFTTLHLMVLGIVFLLALGLLAGWLRWKSGSMYPAMALHLLHNAAVILLTWLGTW
jgi:membrane protease YdiL (CAAX protease family)